METGVFSCVFLSFFQNRPEERRQQRKAAQKAAAAEAPKEKPIEADSYVRVKGQPTIGQVLEINGKTAVVMFGLMKTTVRVERLEHADPPQQQALSPGKASFISSATQSQLREKRLNFRQDIDVRGMRGDEALQAVTYFIDDAILVGVSRVRILHGTGTGILRTLIRQYLSTVSGVKEFRDEHVQFGGAGITVVDLY